MNIGQRLKQWRILLGFSQEEFAEGIMSESYYSKIERGKGSIGTMQLIALLNKNKISLRDFFDEESNSNENFKDLIQVNMLKNGNLTDKYLISLERLFPFLDQAEQKKLMNSIIQLPIKNYEDDSAITSKCAQLAMRYLFECWKSNSLNEAKKTIKYLKKFPTSVLQPYKILLLDYFEAWSLADEEKAEAAMEKMRKVYNEKILKNEPKKGKGEQN